MDRIRPSSKRHHRSYWNESNDERLWLPHKRPITSVGTCRMIVMEGRDAPSDSPSTSKTSITTVTDCCGETMPGCQVFWVFCYRLSGMLPWFHLFQHQSDSRFLGSLGFWGSIHRGYQEGCDKPVSGRWILFWVGSERRCHVLSCPFAPCPSFTLCCFSFSGFA